VSSVAHAVIAAAGLGSRLGWGSPKCLIDLAGETLLARQLRLLKDVPDVRIVVGFEENDVMAAARSIRPDVIFVRNAAFRTTSTLQSYALGAAGLTQSCLFMDADIVFEPRSFRRFLTVCTGSDPIIAITAAKTTDAVFVEVDDGWVQSFARTTARPFEWANLCWLPPRYCETGHNAVFERLSVDLPLRCHEVESLEIDTPSDYAMALERTLAFSL
jgi:choline kinase